MKTLYLHIGTPKTATTAIQFFCRDNQAMLNEHGYYFPIFDLKYPNIQKTRNAHFLVGNINEKQAERDFEQEDQVFQEFFGQVYEAFEQYDNVILSDESLWNFGFSAGGRCWKRIQEELKKNIFTIKVIVYLRRQDEFTYSWWNQVVKEGMHKASVITWEEMAEKLPVVQLNYYERLEKIAEIVGKENIIVRKFDKNQFIGQTIQEDFFHAIGLEIFDECQIPTEVRNVSLTKNYSEIKRILNTLPELDQEGNVFFRSNLSKLSQQFGDDKKYSMLSEQKLREFMAEYEEGNRRIAQEYLDGSEKLFDDNYRVEETWSPGNPGMMEDIVKLFGTTTLLLMKKNEELEKQIFTLKYKLNHPQDVIKNRIKNLWKKTQ